jgi:two-component system LytT family response regulator
MIRAIIVEDEVTARETLSDLLLHYCPQVAILALTDSVKSAVPLIKMHHPELVFLDIEMPFENGFQLFEKFPHQNFCVIFITAYDQYAIKAIKFSAMDYLLKPVNPDELIVAIEKMQHRKLIEEEQRKKIDVLLNSLDHSKKLKQIALPSSKGSVFVDVDTIVRCSADSNYTRFHLSDGKSHLITKNLGEYEELMSGHHFFRVHHSHLVNLNHIKTYIRGNGGYVVMSDLVQVEVSRRKKGEFLKIFAIKR